MGLSNFLTRVLSTFFYIGYFPFIPGTFGSLPGVYLYYCLRTDPVAYFIVTIAIIMAGLISSRRMERILGKKDPSCIVIDEVAGMLLSLAFLPGEIWVVVSGFLIFRLLDTLKPFPAGFIQNLHGGLGVMGDDIIAAIYTNIILQVVARAAPVSLW